jgi:hypothetical protein
MTYINNHRSADARRRNGIIGQTQRYLDTLGNWGTYRDINHVEEIPERIAQVTAAYFGLKGLAEGRIRLSGILGAIILLHTLEQVTGGVATTGMRLYARGKPVASYRSITIRKSPFTPKAAQALDQITGGRLSVTNGYYFFESGRTWYCQALTLQFGGEVRTLTRLHSFSLPQREFFFDRPAVVPGDREPEEGERIISIQRIIDLVKGDELPETIPGFIGSINELESLTILRPIKYLLFMVNWLLIDPAERDHNARPVDYETILKGSPPGGAGSSSIYQVARPPSGPPTTGLWPSTSRTIPASPPPPPYEADLFGAGPPTGSSPANGPTGPATPAARYPDRIRIDHRDYPLVIKRLVASPLNGGPRKVDAIYYDDRVGCWCDIVDEETRLSLARAVEAGLVSVVDPAYWPAT